MKINPYIIFSWLFILIILIVLAFNKIEKKRELLKSRIEWVAIFERYELTPSDNIVKGVSVNGDTINFHNIKFQFYQRVKKDSLYLLEFIPTTTYGSWYKLNRIY